MNRYKKLFKNVGVMTIGNFSSKILSFLLIPLYTNILTTQEYGTADLIFTTTYLLFPVFTLLMSEAVMRFTLDKTNSSQVFSNAVKITTIGTIAFLLFSPLFLLFDAVKDYYFIFIVYYLVYNMHLLIGQFIKGLNRVKEYAIAGIISTLVTITFNIIFLLVFRIGLDGYIYSYILGYLISSLYLIIKCKIWNYIEKSKEIDKKVGKDMLKYSIPMIPNSINWWINNSSDKYMVTYFSGVTSNGIYSVAYKIPSMINIITSIFMSAWQISAVDDFGSEETKKFYSSIYKKYSSIMIVLASLLILFIKFIARMLYAKDFFIAWQCSAILIFGVIFNSLSAFLGTIYTSSKKTKYLFYSTLFGSVFNILLNLLLIPILGPVGAAIATTVSYFIIWLSRLINSRKIMKIIINSLKDSICYVLIIIQIILHLLNFSYSLIFNTIISIIILIINKEIFTEIIKIFSNFLKREK